MRQGPIALAQWFIWGRNVAAILLLISCAIIWSYQRTFIVRRYREESDLWKLKVFQSQVFSRFSSGFLVQGQKLIYTLHLFLIWALSEKTLKRLGSCSDVENRNQVVRHFSKRELWWSVLAGGCYFLALTLGAILLLIRASLSLV